MGFGFGGTKGRGATNFATRTGSGCSIGGVGCGVGSTRGRTTGGLGGSGTEVSGAATGVTSYIIWVTNFCGKNMGNATTSAASATCNTVLVSNALLLNLAS